MIALLAFALAISDPPSPPGRDSARLAADPALAARAQALREQVLSLHWMVGGYDIEVRAEGAPYPVRGFGYADYSLGINRLLLRESYGGFPEQLTFIGYDPAGRRWRSTTIDRNNDVISLHATSWENGRMVFEGEASILGESVYLRRTLTRIPRVVTSDDEDFSIVEEQRVDGRWRLVTTQHFRGRPVN